MVPRENKNNAYAKFGGQTKGIMVFLKVAYSVASLTSGGLNAFRVRKIIKKRYSNGRSIKGFLGYA